jgi:hypothetical protein
MSKNKSAWAAIPKSLSGRTRFYLLTYPLQVYPFREVGRSKGGWIQIIPLPLILQKFKNMSYRKWFEIPGFSKYQISNLFEVRNKELNLIKKFYVDRGYPKSNLVDDSGNRKKPYLHRLVAMVFVPNPDNKPEVHHIDEDTLNFHPSNLQWVTNKEHKEISRLNEQVSHKIKRKEVVFIRDNYSVEKELQLAMMFKVKPTTIRSIATGRSRSDIKEGKIHPLNDGLKKVINILTGERFNSAEEVSKSLGLSLKNIRRQLSGERYCSIPFRYIGAEDKVKFRPKVPIGIFDMEWNLIKVFDYPDDLARFLKTENCSGVYDFIKGRSSMHKGFKFKFVGADGAFLEPIPFISKKPPLKPKKLRGLPTPKKAVNQYDLNNNLIKMYDSMGDAARSVNYKTTDFRKAVIRSPRNFLRGFIWKIQD